MEVKAYLASRASAMMPAAMGAEADVPVWLSLENCQMINHLNTLSPLLGMIKTNKKQHVSVLWFVFVSLEIEICSFHCEVFFGDKLLVFENQYLPF